MNFCVNPKNVSNIGSMQDKGLGAYLMYMCHKKLGGNIFLASAYIWEARTWV